MNIIWAKIIMGSIYQFIFFLGIALLAIVVTVFVLAVSLLGRAVRLSVEEQTKGEHRRKEDNESEIRIIQGKLEQAKTEGRIDIGDLTRSLQDLERKDAKHKWKLRWIRIKPKLLTATWGVFVPGAFFLISAVVSGLAVHLQEKATLASPYMWITSVFMLLGIFFVCLILKVIEGVAITSEETALVRETEAFKTALIEVEEEKRPKLGLTFEDTQPPFHVKAESETVIKVVLGLSSGDVARNATVYFWAPPGFDFPGSPKGIRSGAYPNYVSTKFELGDITKPVSRTRQVKLKAPSNQDNFPLYYILTCEGFDSGYQEFKVVVE